MAILLCSLLLISCKSTGPYYNLQANEVRYFKTTIQNIERDIITITTGAKFKANRLIIAVNMSDAFFILNQLGYGEAYISGTRYSVSIVGDSDSYRYNRGYSNSLKATHADHNILELSDETWWQVIQKGDVDISKWVTTNLMILSEDESVMINPHKIEAIKVKQIENKFTPE